MIIVISYQIGKIVGWEMGWNDSVENFLTNEAARRFPVVFNSPNLFKIIKQCIIRIFKR